MDPVAVASFGVVLTVVGGVLLAYGGSKLRPVYHILTNDPIAVRELVSHTGPAEIEGTARVDEDGRTVRAPFSESECLVCEYEAQEFRSTGQSSYWETLDEGLLSVPFLVEDASGAVRVDAEEVELHVGEEFTEVSAGEQPPEHIARYIDETDEVDSQHDRTVNLVVTEMNVGTNQRFVERRLDVGDSVYVYGDVERGPASEWGSGVVDAILTRGHEAGMLVVSDTSERGTAWRIARVPLLSTVLGLAVFGPGAGALAYALWLLQFG